VDGTHCGNALSDSTAAETATKFEPMQVLQVTGIGLIPVGTPLPALGQACSTP
jgi:hypothetical protein